MMNTEFTPKPINKSLSVTLLLAFISIFVLSAHADFSTGEYVITNVNSNKVISVSNAQTSDGTKIHQWDYTKAPEQIWSFVDAGSGFYKIQSKPSGKMIDVASGLTADGTNTHLWSAASVTSQSWRLDSLGNGEYYIVNKSADKVAAVENNSTANGGIVEIQTKNGGANQKWKISAADNIPTPQGTINPYIKLNDPKTEPMIPKWAFGYWQSQWGGGFGYDTREGFLNHTAALRGIDNKSYGIHKYPTDVMVLDMYWVDQFNASGNIGWNWPANMNWSNSRFPNPKEMIDSLHKINMKISLNYHSGDNAMLNNKLKPEYLAKMKEQLGWGVDVVWLDYWSGGSESETQVWNLLGEQWGANKRRMMFTRHFTRPNIHNHENMDGTTNYRSTDMAPNEDAIQKTMPVHWTGDVEGSWAGYQESIEGIVYGQDGAMDGWSYMHADCPGHSGGEDPELANRWIQFSDFTAVTRNHGYEPRDVWSWGPKYETNSYFSRMLRYRLLPYIYTSSRQIYDKAMPFTRPLKLAFPGQRDDIRYSYMFGDLLLVAPVYKAASQFTGSKMDVYLPEGEQWINFWTHMVYDGGQTVKYDVSAANDKYTPLYVKRGAIIPMGPEIFWIDPAVHPDPLTLDIYPLATGESKYTMYDDDGETNDYKTGSGAFTEFVCKTQENAPLTITIGADIGDYKGKPVSRNYIVKLNLQDSTPKSIIVAGKQISKVDLKELKSSPTKSGWAYDDSANITYVQFSSQTSVSTSVSVSTSGTSGINNRTFLHSANPIRIKALKNRFISIQSGQKNNTVKIRNLQGRLIDKKVLRNTTDLIGPYNSGLLFVDVENGSEVKHYPVFIY